MHDDGVQDSGYPLKIREFHEACTAAEISVKVVVCACARAFGLNLVAPLREHCFSHQLLFAVVFARRDGTYECACSRCSAADDVLSRAPARTFSTTDHYVTSSPIISVLSVTVRCASSATSRTLLRRSESRVLALVIIIFIFYFIHGFFFCSVPLVFLSTWRAHRRFVRPSRTGPVRRDDDDDDDVGPFRSLFVPWYFIEYDGTLVIGGGVRPTGVSPPTGCKSLCIRCGRLIARGPPPF